MGLFGGICSAISSACSIVGNAVSTIGGAITGMASGLVSGIGKMIPVIGNIITAIQVAVYIGNAIVKVAEALGITSGNEKTDELGAKIMQEGTRPINEGETAEEYLNYILNDVELDTEKFKLSTENEKLAYNALGTALEARAIAEKLDMSITDDFLCSIGLLKLNSNFVLNLLRNLSNEGYWNTGVFTSYLRNQLSFNDNRSVSNIVKNTLKSEDPSLSEQDINSKIDDLKVGIGEKLSDTD